MHQHAVLRDRHGQHQISCPLPGKLHAVRKNSGYAAEQQHKGKTLPALRRSGKGGALHGVHHRKVDENRTYEVCAPSEKPEYRVMQPLPKVLSPHEGKRREYNAQCKEQNRIELPLIGAFLRLFRREIGRAHV